MISEKAKIGKNVKFGSFVIVYDDVEIGDNCIIESYCEIGYSNGREKGPLKLGQNAKIRSHSILYAGSEIGENLMTGHHVTIRENMKIGANFQAGTYAIIMGESTIGDYVKTGSSVEIGQFSKLGNYIWVYLNSVLINDPHPPSDSHTKGPEISDFAVIGASCIIFPNVKIGRGALIGANSVVKKDVPDDQIAIGNPSKIIGPTSQIKLTGTDQPAYPWRYHFHRGYPKEVIESWMKEKS